MDVPSGFSPFEPQGPFLEHIGPIQIRQDDDAPVFGLRAEERHTNHRGTIQGGLLSTFADFALGTRDRGGRGGRQGPRDRVADRRLPGGWIEARAASSAWRDAVVADVSLTVEEREIVRARAVWVVA